MFLTHWKEIRAIRRVEIEELKGLITNLMNFAGDDWNDPALLVGQSKMVGTRPKEESL